MRMPFSVRGLSRLVGLVVVGVGLGTLGSLVAQAQATGATVAIGNAWAQRDEVTDQPMVTVDYTVTYASAPAPRATLTCTMTQQQLTRTRTFSGSAIVPGGPTGPHTGTVTIEVPEADTSIEGEFTVECVLRSDRELGRSNTVTVDVPPPGTNVDRPSLCCEQFQGCPDETGSSCGETCCCCGSGERCCPDLSGCCPA
ncbi:MAG: hypothetical protein AB2A00_15350 [Myxococcota bacterium]